MKLYHATTPNKVRKYHASGHRILNPVRGFDSLNAAMAWAMRTRRSVILEIEAPDAIKLPDHHNAFGQAYWVDRDVSEWKCIVSPENTRALKPGGA